MLMQELLSRTLERLEATTPADRYGDGEYGTQYLNGDIWWLTMLDDMRQSLFGHMLILDEQYLDKLIRRDGLSAGKMLASFFDSSKRPPSKLDYAPRYLDDLGLCLRMAPAGYARAIVSPPVAISPSYGVSFHYEAKSFVASSKVVEAAALAAALEARQHFGSLQGPPWQLP